MGLTLTTLDLRALQSVTFPLKQPVFIDVGTKIGRPVARRDRQWSGSIAIPTYRPICARCRSTLQGVCLSSKDPTRLRVMERKTQLPISDFR
jgi:hypothetical protein